MRTAHGDFRKAVTLARGVKNDGGTAADPPTKGRKHYRFMKGWRGR